MKKAISETYNGNSEKLCNALTTIILIAGIGGTVYVGPWLMFIQPILVCCKAFDNGTLTAVLLGWTIIKCFFAGVVSRWMVRATLLISSYVKHSLSR